MPSSHPSLGLSVFFLSFPKGSSHKSTDSREGRDSNPGPKSHRQLQSDMQQASSLLHAKTQPRTQDDRPHKRTRSRPSCHDRFARCEPPDVVKCRPPVLLSFPPFSSGNLILTGFLFFVVKFSSSFGIELCELWPRLGPPETWSRRRRSPPGKFEAGYGHFAPEPSRHPCRVRSRPHRLSKLFAHPLVRALAHVPVCPSVQYLPLLRVLCRLPSHCAHAQPSSHRVPDHLRGVLPGRGAKKRTAG